MTLLDYLIAANAVVPPTAFFAGVLTEDAGPPDENDSPWFLFYRDTETDDLYFCPTRTKGEWELVSPNTTYEVEPAGLEGGILLGFNQSNNSASDGIESITVNHATSTCGYSFLLMADLLEVSFPNLISAAVDINVEYNPKLTSISYPLLVTAGAAFNNDNNSLLTEIYAPLLQTVGANLYSHTNSVLESIHYPSLVTIGISASHMDCGNCPLLVDVELPLYLPPDGTVHNFSGCALSVESVDHILARCVASAGFVSGTVDLSGGTNAIPSAAGLADKATLEGRDPGVTVTVNEEV